MNRLFDNLPIIGKKVPGKITLSFLMLIFAIYMYAVFVSLDRAFAAFAMLFSFVGDVALNHKKTYHEHASRDFVIGGVSFIIAHMFYCIAYSMKIRENNYNLVNFGFIATIVILINITFIFIVSKKRKKNNKLFAFALIYLWITGIDYIVIISYGFSALSFESIAILGALMFLASDIIIGFERFMNLRSDMARELVWWLYPIGQLIIIAIA